jgi:polysaccharide biosynthesis/export protein
MMVKPVFRKLKPYALVLLTVQVLFSCIPQKEIEYIQNPVVDKNVYKLHEKAVIRIKPNDELYIRVASLDDVAFNFFSSQTNSNYMNYSNDISLSLISYTVNDSGNINFPILGMISVVDLTIDEATLKLKILLSEYFNQPTVLMKIVNKKITVIGGVNRPGTYTYVNERINVFEALGLAGDATVHANIRNVMLIRSVNNSIEKIKMDLTKDDVLFSENYFMEPNDILYVKPRSSAKWNATSVPSNLILNAIATALGAVTTTLLIMDYIK